MAAAAKVTKLVVVVSLTTATADLKVDFVVEEASFVALAYFGNFGGLKAF